MSESESELNKNVVDLVESLGGYAVKIQSATVSGVHDILACMYGRFISWDGKLLDNSLSELQVAHQIKVIQAGGLAGELKSLNDALLLINMARNKQIQELPERKLKEFTL